MPLGPHARWRSGSASSCFDWIDKDFRLSTNTLLILFAALQLFSIGLIADLMVRLSTPKNQVDPATQ